MFSCVNFLSFSSPLPRSELLPMSINKDKKHDSNECNPHWVGVKSFFLCYGYHNTIFVLCLMSWFYLFGRKFLFSEKFCNSPFFYWLQFSLPASPSIVVGGCPWHFSLSSQTLNPSKKIQQICSFSPKQLLTTILQISLGTKVQGTYFWGTTIPGLLVREPTPEGKPLRSLLS